MRRALPIISILALAAAFTALNLSMIASNGALAMSPIYDDVGYLLDAYNRLAFDGVNTPYALVQSFLRHPPHAPMSTLTAMAGYALVGPNNFGPYLANAWALMAYALVIFWLARQRLSGPSSALVVALMMFVPASHAIITEFRPDMAAGLIFAFAAWRLISFHYMSATPASSVVLGLLVALAVIAKPSAFIIAIPVLGLCAVLGVLNPASRGETPAKIRSVLLSVLSALVVLIPYAVVWGGHVTAYVYQALVTNKDIWSSPGTSLFHWTFHSIGLGGGGAALGVFFYVGLVLILIDSAISVRGVWRGRDHYNAVAYYAVLGLIYIGLSLSAEKSVFQGSFFYFPLVLAATLALSRLMGRMNSRHASAALAAGAVVAAIFLPTATTYQRSAFFPGSAIMLAQITDAVTNEVQGKPCNLSAPVFAVVSPYPVTPEAVALTIAMKSGIRVEPKQLFLIRNFDEMREAFNSADFVLTPNSWGIKSVQHLPGVAFADAAFAFLSSDASWEMRVFDGQDQPSLFIRKMCR